MHEEASIEDVHGNGFKRVHPTTWLDRITMPT